MELDGVITLVNKINHFTKSEELSKPVKKKLLAILDDIGDSGNMSLEELVLIIGKNNTCKSEEDQLVYREIFEDLALEISQELHHALAHIFSHPLDLGMVYKTIDKNLNNIEYGELVAIKNQLVINSQLVSKFQTPVAGSFSCKEYNKFVNKFFWIYKEDISIGGKILSKVIYSLFVIFDNKLANGHQIDTLMNTDIYGLEIHMTTHNIFDMISYLVEEQLASLSSQTRKTVNEKVIKFKIENLIHKLELYIANQKFGYINKSQRMTNYYQENMSFNEIDEIKSNFSHTDIEDNNIVYAKGTYSNPLKYFFSESKK